MSNPIEKFAGKLERHTSNWMKSKRTGSHFKGDMFAVILVPIIFGVIILVAGVLFLTWNAVVQPNFIAIYAQLQHEGITVNATYQAIPGQIFGYENIVVSWLPIVGWFVLLAIIISALFVEVNVLMWLIDFLLIPIFFWVISLEENMVRSLLSSAVTLGGTTLVSQITTYLQPGLGFIENLQWFAFITMLLYVIVFATRIWFSKPGGTGQRVQQGAGGNTASLSEW